jgi:CRISPR type III-A-associated RAMP protein Csm4
MLRLFRLEPLGPLLVEGGVAGGLLPRSDTISAALVSVWPSANPGTDMAALASKPPFVVSSALPWLASPGKDECILFPLPTGAWPEVCGKDPAALKRAKKALFGDATVLGKLLEKKDPKGAHSWGGGRFVTMDARHGDFAQREPRTRLAVDRLTGGPMEGFLFDTAPWRFSDGCGLAVIADVDESLPSFRAALRLLGMEGIGADRSIGCGQFEIAGESDWTPPELGSGTRMLLSLCRPTQESVRSGILSGRYSLTRRSGWITGASSAGLRRGSVRMLSEGSVLPGNHDRPGDVFVAQVAIPGLGLHHDVYRDGRGLTVPVAGGENG